MLPLGYAENCLVLTSRKLRGSYEYSAAGTRRALSVRQYAFEDEGWHYKPGTEVCQTKPLLFSIPLTDVRSTWRRIR